MTRNWMRLAVVAALVGQTIGTYTTGVRRVDAALEQTRQSTTRGNSRTQQLLAETQRLQSLSEEEKQLSAAVRDQLAALPAESDLGKVVDQISALAQVNSLIAQSRLGVSRPTPSAGRLRTQAVSLSLSGSFEGFYSFLLQVEQMPQRLRVLQISLRPTSQPGQIQGELAMEFPFSPAASASSADAIATRPPAASSLDVDAIVVELSRARNALAAATAPVSAQQIPLDRLKSNPFSEPADTSAHTNSLAPRTDAEGERATVLKAVAGLELQAVVQSGGRSSCMINGSMFQEGQEVQGFTVESIMPASVVVRSGVYRFELKLEH